MSRLTLFFGLFFYATIAYAQWQRIPNQFSEDPNLYSDTFIDEMKTVNQITTFKMRLEIKKSAQNISNMSGGSILKKMSLNCVNGTGFQYYSQVYSANGLKGRVVSSLEAKPGELWYPMRGGDNIFKYVCKKDAATITSSKNQNNASSTAEQKKRLQELQAMQLTIQQQIFGIGTSGAGPGKDDAIEAINQIKK